MTNLNNNFDFKNYTVDSLKDYIYNEIDENIQGFLNLDNIKILVETATEEGTRKIDRENIEKLLTFATDSIHGINQKMQNNLKTFAQSLPLRDRKVEVKEEKVEGSSNENFNFNTYTVDSLATHVYSKIGTWQQTYFELPEVKKAINIATQNGLRKIEEKNMKELQDFFGTEYLGQPFDNMIPALGEFAQSLPFKEENVNPPSQPNDYEQYRKKPPSLKEAFEAANTNPNNNYVSPRLNPQDKTNKQLKDKILTLKKQIADILGFRGRSYQGSYTVQGSDIRKVLSGQKDSITIENLTLTKADIKSLQDSYHIFYQAGTNLKKLEASVRIKKAGKAPTTDDTTKQDLSYTSARRVMISDAYLGLNSDLTPRNKPVPVKVIDISGPILTAHKDGGVTHRDQFIDRQSGDFKKDKDGDSFYFKDGLQRFELLLKACNQAGVDVPIIPGVGEGVFAAEFAKKAALEHARGLRLLLEKQPDDFKNLKGIVLSFIGGPGSNVYDAYKNVFNGKEGGFNAPYQGKINLFITDKEMAGVGADIYEKSDLTPGLVIAAHPTGKVGNGTHPDINPDGTHSKDGAQAQEETITTMLLGTNIIAQEAHFNDKVEQYDLKTIGTELKMQNSCVFDELLKTPEVKQINSLADLKSKTNALQSWPTFKTETMRDTSPLGRDQTIGTIATKNPEAVEFKGQDKNLSDPRIRSGNAPRGFKLLIERISTLKAVSLIDCQGLTAPIIEGIASSLNSKGGGSIQIGASMIQSNQQMLNEIAKIMDKYQNVQFFFA